MYIFFHTSPIWKKKNLRMKFIFGGVENMYTNKNVYYALIAQYIDAHHTTVSNISTGYSGTNPHWQNNVLFTKSEITKFQENRRWT